MENTKLKKFIVCADCFSYTLTDPNCRCAYSNYKTIELEFEVCACCENIISDGQPEETKFNEEQIKKNNL